MTVNQKNSARVDWEIWRRELGLDFFARIEGRSAKAMPAPDAEGSSQTSLKQWSAAMLAAMPGPEMPRTTQKPKHRERCQDWIDIIPYSAFVARKVGAKEIRETPAALEALNKEKASL